MDSSLRYLYESEASYEQALMEEAGQEEREMPFVEDFFGAFTVQHVDSQVPNQEASKVDEGESSDECEKEASLEEEEGGGLEKSVEGEKEVMSRVDEEEMEKETMKETLLKMEEKFGREKLFEVVREYLVEKDQDLSEDEGSGKEEEVKRKAKGFKRAPRQNARRLNGWYEQPGLYRKEKNGTYKCLRKICRNRKSLSLRSLGKHEDSYHF